MSGYYTIAFNLSYVPEPNSLAILGLGCVCLARKTRRQRGQRA